MASSNTGGGARLSAKTAEKIQQNLPPSSHGGAQSSSLLNLPSRNSNSGGGGGGGGGQIRPSSRPKDRPSSSSSSACTSSSRRSATPATRSQSKDSDNDNDHSRVRVAVRVRPRNAEELVSDADFGDFIELQPELKRLKLKKNNWSSESYRFDEVFTETASQKRVYEVVAKPVVESVLSGYNGTIMAYGQTGTGKTYTVGRMGKEDVAERGIMVRALEDILASTSVSDSVEISYLQLYMESIQDLLAPERNNIAISEDKNGEVTVPGATVAKIQDLNDFFEVLQVGETNRHAANTKLNTESSRSHAILMISVRRSVSEKEEGTKTQDKESKADMVGDKGVPKVRKSKLLIVDLAGSERIDKSGTDAHLIEEAKFINLSLTSLGKCINALAENSPHIPTRDSKLTRLLRDSFGGSARTSLIIAIGPSAKYHAETSSTIMFGQRAMRIVNMVKLKEEFDYESLCRKLETQVDHLTAEVERQKRLRDSDKHNLEKKMKECQDSLAEAETSSATRSEFLERENTRLEVQMKEFLTELEFQKEQNCLMREKTAELETSLNNSKHQQHENTNYHNKLADNTQRLEQTIADLVQKLEDEQARSRAAEEHMEEMKKILSKHQKSIQQQEMDNYQYQKELADTTHTHEMKVAELHKQLEDEHARFEAAQEQLVGMNKLLQNQQESGQLQEEINELKQKLQRMCQVNESVADELQSVRLEYDDLLQQKDKLVEELGDVKQRLVLEEKQRKQIEYEIVKLKKATAENENSFEGKRSYIKEELAKGISESGGPTNSHRSNVLKKSLSGQRATIARLCEEVGLHKILQLIKSEDAEVQIHAVKVVANLAAEESNQVKIVEEGGLDALLMLLESSQNATILRVASGAIANLAMNEINQDLIMNKGGSQLLAKTATKTDDPQTLRMVAGALANLCGNEKLLMMLKEEGGIKALLGMAKSRNMDTIAQVARGMANFAKCETREIMQGRRKGHSLLLEEGGLEWLISNSHIDSASTQRHIELALCHLAQNEDNAKDFLTTGGVKELIRISVESGREDIRSLAKKILKSNSLFRAELAADQR